VVQGVLCVDDFVDSLQFLSGSQLVAIPYEYKVGGRRLPVLAAASPTRSCGGGS